MIEIEVSVPFEYGLIELRSDNILTFEPAPDMDSITLDYLKVSHEIFMYVTKGTPRPFFSNNISMKNTGGAAEKKFIKQNFHKFASACGMTEKHAITRHMVHLFLHIYQPRIPIKMFKTKEEAITWLKSLPPIQ